MKVKTLFLVIMLIIFEVTDAQIITGRTFPLVVQFASFCCGVPSDTTIVNYVKRFKKNYKIKTISAYKLGPMGREGEYYLAFPLKELSKVQAKKFITEIKRVKIANGDKGAIHYESNYTVNDTGSSNTVIAENNLIKF